MNAYGYTVMFGILNNRNQYFRNSLNSQTDLLDFMEVDTLFEIGDLWKCTVLVP